MELHLIPICHYPLTSGRWPWHLTHATKRGWRLFLWMGISPLSLVLISSASSIHSYNIHPSILIRLMNLRAFGGALIIELKGCISMTYHLIYRCPVRWSLSNHQIWRHQSGLWLNNGLSSPFSWHLQLHEMVAYQIILAEFSLLKRSRKAKLLNF